MSPTKPRPVTTPQLSTLHSIGALQLVPPGTANPLTYDQAWKVLEEALAAGLWTPKRKEPKPRRRSGTPPPLIRVREGNLYSKGNTVA